MTKSRRSFPPRLYYCSDYDGWCRYAVADATKVDLSGWKLELARDPSCPSWGDGAQAPVTGRVGTSAFELDDHIWRCGTSWNYLGIGEKASAWVAMADWGGRVVAFISPEGHRTPVEET